MKKSFFDNIGCLLRRQPFFFILFIILSTACKNESNYNLDKDVLFEVNGVERTVFDFESEYVDHLISTGRNDTKEERYGYMYQMIDNLLLAQTGAEKGLIAHPIYQGALAYQERKSMVDMYFVDEMDQLLEPSTDDEIRLAYAKKQRKVYVRHLFSKNPDDLEEPYQRLLDGEDYVDVANDFYETPEYDSTAGYIGPVSYFGVEDAFAEAAYSTNEKEFTKPIRTRYGYHIIFVEYIVFPAMLTEDDFQYRKKGVTSQLRLRKQQLVSNDYIRTLMEGLNVKPNRANISDLRQVILNLDDQVIISSKRNREHNTSNIWTDKRIELLATSFDQNKVLATFENEDKVINFTFGDYLLWLPYLSFQESKNQTGASIGRGLRNEVLYQLAEEKNYDNDERVKEKVKKRGFEILSELYQYDLTMAAIDDTSMVEIPKSYTNRLINSKEIFLQAEYWKIYAKSMKDAEKIKEAILSGDPPISYDSYEKIELSSISITDNDFDLVKKAVLQMPTIAYSEPQGWLVFNVLTKNITEKDNIKQVANIETRYKIYNSLTSELKRLREDASIKIDTVLFDEIYNVWKNNKE